MVKALVIGVDSSTTACKTIAWDRDGAVVAEGRAGHSVLHPEPDWHEQDAEQWWTSLCAALRDLLGQVDASRVEAICITHQRESFVPVDGEGRPIRNAILWIEERSRPQLNFLDEALGADRVHQITGKPPSLTQSLPKILWLAQNEPDILTKAHKILDVQGFLVHRLTGNFRTSLASADPMALVDTEAGAWAGDLLHLLGLGTSQLSDLVPPGEVIGRVSHAAGQAIGLPAGLPLVAGAGDGQCAGLGANATSGGRAYLNLGTAVVSGVLSTDFLVDPAFRTLTAPIAGAYYLETVLRGGVFTVGWFVDRFASDLSGTWLPLSAEEMLEAAAAKLRRGASGLMLVPYWSGVMSPYWDPAASGITIGWGRAHGRVHLYRSILEGVAFEQRLAGDGVMAALEQRFTEYVVMGGGSRSGLWCQIVADVTGVPIVRSATTEATCLGAGILAAAAVGWYTDACCAAEAMTRVTDRFVPDPEAQAIYDPLYREVYKPLFPAVRPFVDRLAELTDNAP